MRIVFMGTPAYAVPTLEALIAAGHDVVAVYARADAASGRGKTLHPCEVKVAALEHGIEVLTPATFKDDEAVAQLAAFEPDAIVVAAYGMLLPQSVLDIPRLGTFNVHASLLPRWRGAAPIQRAILAGDEETGVCSMKVELALDAGDYITAGSVPVEGKTTDEVTAELARIGAAGMVEALAAEEAGNAAWVAQDESLVTYAAKIDKEETLLLPGLSAADAMRRILASNHRAPARCIVCGKEVQVIAATPASDDVEAGAVLLQKKRIALGFADGALELVEVKPQGKKEMPVQGWINGLRNAEPVWSAV